MNIAGNVRFGLLQGTYWMTYCCMFPFLVKLYAHYGYNDFIIGLFITATMVANLIAQPLWGAVCDKLTRIKPFFVAIVCLGAAASVILPFAKDSPWLVAISVVLMAGTLQSVMYIIDMWSVRLNSAGARINYGFTRSFGSAFYAITAIIFGIMLDMFGFGIMTPVFVACCACLILVVLTVDESGVKARPKNLNKKERPSFIKSVGVLIKNKPYVVFVISYFLIAFGNSPLFNYLPRKFEELGAGGGLYGTGLFLMAISEVPVLLMLNRLRRAFGAHKLVMMSFIGMILRVTAIALAPTPELLVAAQLLQMVSCGLYIGASVAYMSEIVDQSMLFTAQTILAAITVGCSGILGNIIGGALASTLGVITMMKLCIIPVVCGTLLFCAGAGAAAGTGDHRPAAARSGRE